MNKDKAGLGYWAKNWNQYLEISKIDINYYTNRLLHKIFTKYLNYNKEKDICEIGCAFSPYLLYFHDHFGYRINGFDYEGISVKKTKEIYDNMGYCSNIYHHDFFDIKNCRKYDILTSFGVFEHFEDLNSTINLSKYYLKDNGTIVTVIPNMCGFFGFLQRIFDKRIYDIHIPYDKNDILLAHETNGYKTLFCDYAGIYQFGVVNISNIKYNKIIKKFFSLPRKPLYYFLNLFNISMNYKINSPYIIYIGKAKEKVLE